MEGQSHLRQNQRERIGQDAVLSHAITARSTWPCSDALNANHSSSSPPPSALPVVHPHHALASASTSQLSDELFFWQEDSPVVGSATHILYLCNPQHPSSVRPSLMIHPGSEGLAPRRLFETITEQLRNLTPRVLSSINQPTRKRLLSTCRLMVCAHSYFHSFISSFNAS